MPRKNVRIELHHFPARVQPIVRKAAQRTLSGPHGNRSGCINFILISDQEIKKLNRKFRKVCRITDVISFRYSASPLEGDIFIGRGRSQKQARQQGHSWEKELAYLAIHGVLHLFGYTDYTPYARRKMFRRQDTIWQCLFS
jgi:probable rRNA maturation factor